jgi:uncharacterized protein YkwD
MHLTPICARRRRHQVTPLVWDAQMAAQAAEFAASCPMGRSGKAGLGENLAFGYPDAASAVDACKCFACYHHLKACGT